MEGTYVAFFLTVYPADSQKQLLVSDALWKPTFFLRFIYFSFMNMFCALFAEP